MRLVVYGLKFCTCQLSLLVKLCPVLSEGSVVMTHLCGVCLAETCFALEGVSRSIDCKCHCGC